MIESMSSPRILLISQWPKVRNGEYELIERIKQTGFKITVVDYLGFSVDTGECLNHATIMKDFDFAIAFHYDTPKFINLPTFLWVANPLAFMHLRNDYRSLLLHQLRAFDDYLYNGSDILKTHISKVVGSQWCDTGLEMFPACSHAVMLPPKESGHLDTEKVRKIFYCGINWERGIDRAGRAQGLLDLLQEKNIADFYGPQNFDGMAPWAGFTSYQGEIPFDGASMAKIMQNYGAVLAISSPAHMKSCTSSSRVLEGIAAGVPVISDENPHVKKLFGDTVYYFRGTTEEARAQSILEIFQHILQHPEEAYQHVIQAQALMVKRYCFEPCFATLLAHVKRNVLSKTSTVNTSPKQVDVILFHHDPDPSAQNNIPGFQNTLHIIEAAGYAAKRNGIQVRIICCAEQPITTPEQALPAGVSWQACHTAELGQQDWLSLRMGEKVALLTTKVVGDFATFLTQFDFPHYDSFSKALDWFEQDQHGRAGGIHIGGFYVNNLSQSACFNKDSILRNNISINLYRWTQNSFAEHQLAMLFFHKPALRLLAADQISHFDATLPVVIIATAVSRQIPLHRSRYILMRVQYSHFLRHYQAYQKAIAKGFWAQHYDLITNYAHELNALYDVFHEEPLALEIADHVSGQMLSTVSLADSAIYRINKIIDKLRPINLILRKIRNIVLFRWISK